MPSFLDRLRTIPPGGAAPASTGAAAATAPAPTTPPPVPTADSSPQVNAGTTPPVTASAPAPAPTPPPAGETAKPAPTPPVQTTAVSRPAPVTGVVSSPVVASLIDSDEDMEQFAASLMPNNTKQSLGAVIEGAEGSGMKLTHPFASVKKGNWAVHKDCPENIKEFMPMGGETSPKFHGVYLGYRLAANIWPGEPGDGGSPTSSFAVPDLNVAGLITKKLGFAVTSDDLHELAKETMAIANKVQYTKKDDRARYWPKGRLAPELHILVWTPMTSYILLVVPTYTGVTETNHIINTEVEPGLKFQPVTFAIKNHTTVNKNAKPGADNYQWVNSFVQIGHEKESTKAMNLNAAWNDYRTANRKEVMNQLAVFLCGEDFEGLSIPEMAGVLTEFKGYADAIPKKGARGSTATE